MQAENKNCQNCKKGFVIEPQDFAFYEKIKVPAPTFCPQCRFQRRLMFRNERTFYKRKCDLCEKDMLTIFSPESDLVVYCQDCWWSDKWDDTEHFLEYNSSRPFFEQMAELQKKTPHMALINDHLTLVNSDYVNHAGSLKNCYLIFNADFDENVLYSAIVVRVKDSMDCYMVGESELMYQNIDISDSYRLFFSEDGSNCSESYFLKNCTGCDNCFGCINQKKKRHSILNKQYSPEECAALRARIIEDMKKNPYVDSAGRVWHYGEFLPYDLSPFMYNESQAIQYYPLSKEQVLKNGWKWRESSGSSHTITLPTDKIPDSIYDVQDDILKQIIGCDKCGKAFKITSAELQLLRRFKFPIPRFCPDCRHMERMARINPPKLWRHQCMKGGCLNEFETSYAPDRPEIVYCEQCYNAEVA